MSLLQSALTLAEQGFHVFPLKPQSKLPAIEGFPSRATRDPATIRKWWLDPVLQIEQPYNIGISTTHFGDDEALLVLDIDNKAKKKGDDELFKLELAGRDFPPTFEQTTPSGGRHLLYRVKNPVKQGSNVLAPGLDIRSRGGYVCGAGSLLEGDSSYKAYSRPLSEAPTWLVEVCGESGDPKRNIGNSQTVGGIEPSRATARATFYLLNEAPLATEGESGDQTTFQVACRVKDFGVDADTCAQLMFDHWNTRCSPPWDLGGLAFKVDNAYAYGSQPIGVADPAADFEKLPTVGGADIHPFHRLNEEYAFVVTGGSHHILFETFDYEGNPDLQHLDPATFHLKHAAQTMAYGGEEKQVTRLWINSPDRRSYDGLVFAPEQEVNPRFYNLWRGFSCKPLPVGEKPKSEWSESLRMFLEHAKMNVCAGDPALYHWLIGYFAHLVQKPWEKPLTALVFRGKKGVGKNALIERIGSLLGSHSMVTSDSRYLLGNFNGHLEKMLLFTLDEAFWSGDKKAEGVLKNLITGTKHVIEHKGREPFTVANCTRVCIIGNEEWLVPASHDERRFAVFNVGDGRQKDRLFFRTMRENMEAGGYSLLLRYLMDFDLKGVDVDNAPDTIGLMEQKINSLNPFYEWWLECLREGRVVGSDFGDEWSVEVSKERFRDAFRRHIRDRNVKGRFADDRKLGKLLSICLPSLDSKQKKREEGARINIYRLPDLATARAEWSKFIGHEETWE